MCAARAHSDSLTLLVTCVGRRVELLQAFRSAAARLGIDLRIVAVDSQKTAPGLYVADAAHLLCPADNPAYVDAVLAVARQEHAACVIPTTDTDLLALSARRDDFDAIGCVALIADEDAIRTCRDKTRTFEFLQSHGVDTPRTYAFEQLGGMDFGDLAYPLMLKPRTGSASHMVAKILDAEELAYHLQRVPDAIVQEFVDGVEHTLDAYVGLTGQVRCMVPRKRLQVRGGEVSKGVTVKDPRIMAAGRQVAEALGPSTRGLLTLQCMVTADGQIRFIEINPRFGGGAPLGIAAGADYPLWLLQELLGQTPEIAFDGWQDRLYMLRHDWSIFVAETDLDAPKPDAPLHPPPPFA